MPGLKTLLAVLALTLGLPAQAAVDAGSTLAQRLKAMATLQTDFTQTSQVKGRPPQVVTGLLLAQKPGLFRWEVRQPYQQLIVSDGKEIRIHDADLMQMTIRPLGKEWGQTPALLFSGDVRGLGKQFSIRQKSTGALTEFVLTPKAKDSTFAHVTLQFKGKLPHAMHLKDSLGQTTRIEFFRARLNAPIAAGQFRFTPPAGTDVIRE